MALSGLSTGNSAGFVKDFRVSGAWRETNNDEYAQGRIPDNSMLLSIVLRNAVDRMTNLRTVW